MANSITCPNCNSTQISAQKRGFSGGKAVAGAVVAGGVGALAGLHGSNDIENHCMKCGYSWKPANQFKADVQQRVQAEQLDEDRAKAQFYKDYESGLYEYAKRNVPPSAKVIYERDGIEAAYTYLKELDRSTKRTATIWTVSILAVLLAIVAYIAYSCD